MSCLAVLFGNTRVIVLVFDDAALIFDESLELLLMALEALHVHKERDEASEP